MSSGLQLAAALALFSRVKNPTCFACRQADVRNSRTGRYSAVNFGACKRLQGLLSREASWEQCPTPVGAFVPLVRKDYSERETGVEASSESWLHIAKRPSRADRFWGQEEGCQ